MEDDVIDPGNDLDFDEGLAGKESTTMGGSGAIGSLSDVEIDYETRSEISEDDEGNAEDAEKYALNTAVKGESVVQDKIPSEKSESSKESRPTKTNGKRSLTRETKDEELRSTKRPKTEKTSKPSSSKSNHSEIEESALEKLSQNTKFFLMKTSDTNNLKVSQEREVWFTDPQNVTVLNAAVDASKNVILIFSAKWTGKFTGFALLKGRSTSDDPPRDWAPSIKTLGGLFHVRWLSRKELLFVSSNHLRNPCSGGKLVSICVDGQEIDQKIGLELCQLLLRKGIEPKETPNLQKNEPPVESKQESEKYSSKSRKFKRTENQLSYSPLKGSPRIEENYNQFDRRGRSLDRRGRSPDRRGRPPVCSERHAKNEHSTDRVERTEEKYRSRKTARRGSTVCIDLRYKTSRGQNPSQGSYDGKGKSDVLPPLNDMDCRHEIFSDLSSPSGKSETNHFEYLSDDDLDVSGEQPSRTSGRFVIERSPIRQTDGSPSPMVQNELSPDNYELMSENRSESRVELSNKGVVAPERYCTIVTDELLELSPSPERISEVPREVYETHESLGRHHSRSQATHNDEHYQLDQSNGKSPSHWQNKTNYLSGNARDIYMSNESIGRYQSRRRSPSSSRSINTVYSSREASRRRSSSRVRSQRRSPSLIRSPRRSPSVVGSHTTHTVYESHGSTRKTSSSRDRSEITLREYPSHESSRMRSQYYDRPLDTNMEYQQELTERSSSRRHTSRSEIPSKRYSPMRETNEEEMDRHKQSRTRQSPDVISREYTPSQEIIDYEREERHRIRAEESARGYRSRDYDLYNKRSPMGVSGSENRSHYSVPDDFPDTSSHHISSGSRHRIRESSEHREDRIKVYNRDERFSYDGKSRLTPEREPRSYTMERAPERIPEYRHSHGERHDHERPKDYYSSSSLRPKDYYYSYSSLRPKDYSSSASHRPKDYDTRRSESAHGGKNHYYGYGSQNLALSMVPIDTHSPTPAPSSYLPASHVNYYQGNPPPLLPPVSSKFFEPAIHPSPPKYNPTVPPPMIPPTPSKYIDDVPGVPPVPPRFQQGGAIPPPPARRLGGSWMPGTSNYHRTPSQSISAEEFIKLCQNKKPIRPLTTSGSRRRH